ncbi:Imm32 family immunity protein [Ferviditalea candida]|uniref:Imm32 family immunity protein n=1 Tax=Ferviditalea candida TaxID=3108399 RepID=A0ABU5ZNF2_9BACL|nr:Imm32 family immunity protein [Paenibacillaceae bacterium T2]
MDKFLLTFEFDKENEKIEIHADKYGLLFLKQKIDVLLQKGGDVHLMTPSWGGQELSEEQQNENSILLHHVKILYWN